MKNITLDEMFGRVEAQMPLMYVSAVLCFSGFLILFIIVLDLISSWKRLLRWEKRQTVVLGIVLLLQIAGVSMYFYSTLKIFS
ncbi:MAG: hypothetical protein H2212_12830 [Ruminococcus sp.]|nr:hypothetical protein [Ruminococcus sp.]